jgi:hypothetical protein
MRERSVTSREILRQTTHVFGYLFEDKHCESEDDA